MSNNVINTIFADLAECRVTGDTFVVRSVINRERISSLPVVVPNQPLPVGGELLFLAEVPGEG